MISVNNHKTNSKQTYMNNTPHYRKHFKNKNIIKSYMKINKKIIKDQKKKMKTKVHNTLPI